VGDIDDLHDPEDEAHPRPKQKEERCVGDGVIGLDDEKIHAFLPYSLMQYVEHTKAIRNTYTEDSCRYTWVT